MKPPRSVTVVFSTLVLAGVAKLGLSAMSYVQPGHALSGADFGSSYFVTAASAATEEPTAAPTEAPPLAGLPEGTPDEMLAAITAERELLENQRSVLAQRAAEIDLAKEMLAIETARLEELKQEVEALLERASMAHVADVDRLVALYSNMKPKDAAAIMDDLDLEVTVTVLGTMAERNAAPILAALNPVRARALSLILLERAKLPGDRRLDRIRLN
jgi:flagellar motility protein MotE (MotC chaperone)